MLVNNHSLKHVRPRRNDFTTIAAPKVRETIGEFHPESVSFSSVYVAKPIPHSKSLFISSSGGNIHFSGLLDYFRSPEEILANTLTHFTFPTTHSSESSKPSNVQISATLEKENETNSEQQILTPQKFLEVIATKDNPRKFVSEINELQKLMVNNLNHLQALYRLATDCSADDLDNLTRLNSISKSSLIKQLVEFATSRPNASLKRYITLVDAAEEGIDNIASIQGATNLLTLLPDSFFDKNNKDKDAFQALLKISKTLIISNHKETLKRLAENLSGQDLWKLQSLGENSLLKLGNAVSTFASKNPEHQMYNSDFLDAYKIVNHAFQNSEVALDASLGLLQDVEPDRLIETAKTVAHIVHVGTEKAYLKGSSQKAIAANLLLLFNAPFPEDFLSYYLDNKNVIHPLTVNAVAEYINTKPGYGRDPSKNLAPELLAMAETYAISLQSGEFNNEKRFNLTNNFLKALKKALSETLGSLNATAIDKAPTALDMNLSHAYSNLTRSSSIGLSFVRWKMDTMARWKGLGPMQRPSLFEHSGLFKKIGPRPDDSVFHGGFLHYDPQIGISIEMRRAYIVVSHKEHGTLVIRNSSNKFGRDKLPEPVYYSPATQGIYSDEQHLFSPERDLPKFSSILSGLPQTQSALKNKQNEDIHQLLNGFDGLSNRYIQWKNGFKNGQPPAGFLEMLRTALMTHLYSGAKAPFKAFKNVHMSWVTAQNTPTIAKTFESNSEKNLKELEFYEAVLSGKLQVKNPEEYQKQMPNLLQFLSYGLKNKGYELILTDTN